MKTIVPTEETKQKFISRTPRFPLGDYIFSVWATESFASHQKIRILPDGCSVLLFNFSKPVEVQSIVTHAAISSVIYSGINTTFYDLNCTGSHEQVGVIFKPFGGFPMMDIPSDEFYNTVVEIDLIDKNKFTEIFDKMGSVSDLNERLTLLENWLTFHLCDKPIAKGMDHLIALIQSRQGLTSAQLAAKAGFTQQHTSRLFKKYIGTTPKTIARIYRFRNALDLMQASDNMSLTDICYEANYYDQAHFIKEFQSLSGLTPGAIAQKISQNQQRILIR